MPPGPRLARIIFFMDLTRSSARVFPWGLYALLSLWSMTQVSRKVSSSAEIYCGPLAKVSTSVTTKVSQWVRRNWISSWVFHFLA